MKRFLCFALVLIVLLPFAFLSCSDADHDALIGRWETEGTDEKLGTYSMVYHFTEEGEIFVEQKQGDDIPFSIPFGTWYAEDDELTIKSDGNEKTFTFSVSDSKLTLSEDGEESLVFHRL